MVFALLYVTTTKERPCKGPTPIESSQGYPPELEALVPLLMGSKFYARSHGSTYQLQQDSWRFGTRGVGIAGEFGGMVWRKHREKAPGLRESN